MQYAANLPNTRNLLVPLLALTIGAAGATAAYAILDDTDVTSEATRVVVPATSPPSAGVAAKNEAGTAAAIAAPAAGASTAGKDEAATAAAIGSSGITPSEAAAEAARTDPHGAASSLPRSVPQRP